MFLLSLDKSKKMVRLGEQKMEWTSGHCNERDLNGEETQSLNKLIYLLEVVELKEGVRDKHECGGKRILTTIMLKEVCKILVSNLSCV